MGVGLSGSGEVEGGGCEVGWSGEAALEFCKAVVVRHCSKNLQWPRSKILQRPLQLID